MSGFDALKVELKDAFRRREIRRVVYTHCDHWEPWRPLDGFSAICAQNRDEVHRFVDVCSASEICRGHSLFYKCPINFIFDHDRYQTPGVKCDPADGVRFVERSAQQMEITREAMARVAGSSMDVQVHIHHENVTHNSDHARPEVAPFLYANTGRRLEESRFALLLSLALQSIRTETGRPLDRWFFVHGHWGLNASDPAVCHMTREIAILMDHGCLGDFTVPSGRPAVNPRLEVPYFVTPVDAAKGYDLQESEPELAYGNRTAPARGKFFMWSSVVKHRGASLDYYAPWLRKRLEDLRSLALEIIAQSYAVDGTLFVKSHAHSMHPNYYIDTPQAVFPHMYPPIQALFGLLFEAAAAAGASVEFKTASQLYEAFTTADFKPDGGFGLTMPGSPPVVDGCQPADRTLVLRTRVISAPSKSAAVQAAIRFEALVDDASPDLASGQMAPQPTEPIAHGVLIGLTGRRIAQSLEAEVGAEHLGDVCVERARHWSFLTSYQSQLVRYLAGLKGYKSYQEIGCGLGVMSVALAASGLPAVGIDGHAVRISGARRVLEDVTLSLRTQGKSLPAGCEFVLGTFPHAAAGWDVSSSLACVTDFISEQPLADVSSVVSGLARYAAVVIDLQRFDRARMSRKDAEALMTELQVMGLGPGRVVLDLGSDGLYAQFSPPGRA